MKLPNCNKPCKDCPFRKDIIKGWLGSKRMTEIVEAESFVCHKNHKLQCAGHMLLLEDANVFYRTANIFRHPLKLEGRELVFDTIQEAIEHHKFD